MWMEKTSSRQASGGRQVTGTFQTLSSVPLQHISLIITLLIIWLTSGSWWGANWTSSQVSQCLILTHWRRYSPSAIGGPSCNAVLTPAVKPVWSDAKPQLAAGSSAVWGVAENIGVCVCMSEEKLHAVSVFAAGVDSGSNTDTRTRTNTNTLSILPSSSTIVKQLKGEIVLQAGLWVQWENEFRPIRIRRKFDRSCPSQLCSGFREIPSSYPLLMVYTAFGLLL